MPTPLHVSPARLASRNLSTPRKWMPLLASLLALWGAGLRSAEAIVDLNGNGMSDVWEQYFQAASLNPTVDTDGDGQSNLAESRAGTNPFDATSVFKVTQVSVAGGNVTLKWTTTAGQRYQVQTTANLVAPTWQDLGTPFVGTGAVMTASFGLSNGEQQKYFRITVSSLDSDSDGVTDWEEIIAGLEPSYAHTGGGSVDDLTRLTTAVQATTDTITIVASDPYATRLGSDTGAFTVARTGKLDAVTVSYA
ncbi:MAG: thrombospondin type 3 repeat-containing protein, partial [Chthoniobacterales bacterium]